MKRRKLLWLKICQQMPLLCGFWFELRHLSLFAQDSDVINPFCLHISSETAMQCELEAPVKAGAIKSIRDAT
jgi:hypothetical protein